MAKSKNPLASARLKDKKVAFVGTLELGRAAKAFFDAAGRVKITLSTSVDVMRGEVWARLELELAKHVDGLTWRPIGKICSVKDSDGLAQRADLNVSPHGIEELWLALGTKWHGAIVDPTTTTLSTWVDQSTKKNLLKLATFAWCELLATPLDKNGTAKQATSAHRAAQTASVKAILKRLRSGPRSVKQFAKTGLPPWMKRNVVNLGWMHWFPQWLPLDLAGTKLPHLVMRMVHSSGADFASADLSHSDLFGCVFPRGNFEGAILRGAKLVELKMIGGNLRNADLSEADLGNISLRDACCNNACFRNADLSHSNLCRADLTGADLSGANLRQARYDKDTKWPMGFEPTAEMRWMGAGASPMVRKQVRSKAPKKRLDIKAFTKRLEEIADAKKLEKALSMLKAEQFQLFAEISDERLVGVVKSQVKPDLVYSCTITCDGAYGCCTPDLKPCWGMRGSLCKHLLLLIIGLANNGDIDPNIIDHWVQLSRGLKPVLAKEALADTLVRYKGAQTGEVDWRPTETIPEDFYAM